MKLKNPEAEIFIPDNVPESKAFERTTHMGISAHQDDLEIMAYHGILECFGREQNHFFGVTVTDGAGSPRDDIYAGYSDEQMKRVRKLEQKKAAVVGEYSGMALLNYSSADVKSPGNTSVKEELKELFRHARPTHIYTHNLADKHDTHVAVALKTIQALRERPAGEKPKFLYGCEVWRNLDWMPDEDKVVFDVSGQKIWLRRFWVYSILRSAGEKYDLATMGRRRSNATYFSSHGTDRATGLIFAMNLTPLIADPGLDIIDFVSSHMDKFAGEVKSKLKNLI